LESVWRQVVDRASPQQDRIGELLRLSKIRSPGQTKTDELNAKVDQLMAEQLIKAG